VIGVAMATRQPANVDERTPSQLELLSMRDARDHDTLTISGLVRNGRKSADVDHVTAVVFAFGSGGNFMASGRAPIEILRLRPGEESPFLVTVPGVADA